MNDKELKRLKRGDLLEVLLEQSKENDCLKKALEEKEKQIQELTRKLEDKTIDLENAGTIAEASFKLNGVLEAAENAARQYLDNLSRLSEKEEILYQEKEKVVEARCEEMLRKTKEQCEKYLKITEQSCIEREQAIRELLTSFEVN